MSRALQTQEVLQSLYYTVNPQTTLPYSTNVLQVADGQGLRSWRTVFETISTQSVLESAPLGYLPSTILAISNDTSTFSSIVATSYSTLSTQIGIGGIPGSITVGQLASTTTWITDPVRYISTGNLTSSMTPFLTGNLSFMSNIQSTVNGLGTARYVSTATLFSTTAGIGAQTVSTARGLGSLNYVSTLSLQSSLQGLSQMSYISTSALVSTVTGLIYPPDSGGSLGLVVTGTTDPPFRNFSTLTSNYLSTNQFINTTTAPVFGFVFSNQLPSTTTGLISSLGTVGYVSTATLLSTSAGIQAAKQNIFIDRTGAVSITNSQVFLSTVGAITFLSSFVDSTITYKGQNGSFAATVATNSNLNFSTANLQFDLFSSLITSSSRLTVELYPTFAFEPLTAGALTSKLQPLVNTIQYGPHILSSIVETRIPCISATSGFSNIFQQPLKFSIPGSTITGNYVNPYTLTHSMTGGLSYGLNVGFRDSNLTVFYPSTNSVFLSVQNLSF
jgi:hypothetical protein